MKEKIINRKLLNELIQNELIKDTNIFQKSNTIIDIFIFNDLLNDNFTKDYLTIPYLMSLHNLDFNSAKSLLEFSFNKTIKFKECYGNGSIIYPMWKKNNLK